MLLENTKGFEAPTVHPAALWQRRYDVDWLRIFALGLLIFYHVAVGFQPWARSILFIQNHQTITWLWYVMSLINIWRIPILFLISGMGVRFAMERRDWYQLLKDRSVRILVPFIFGCFFISPIFLFITWKYYYNVAAYWPTPGHLWFLSNIFLYVLLLLPLIVYLRNRPGNFVFRFLAGLFRRPWALYIAALPMMAEAWLLDPQIFALYGKTSHGFWLGLICFMTGFTFVSVGDVFWRAVEKVRLGSLAAAFALYLIRLMVFRLEGVPNLLIAFESMCWMLAALGYGSIYLNKPSGRLAYFSTAVYPVYIVHMPVQFAIAYFILPLPLPAMLKLALMIAGTFGISLLMYEYGLKRSKWIRPLFGMKPRSGWYLNNRLRI